MGGIAKSLNEVQEEINQLDPRYIAEKIIGAGSYGMVIRARDTSDGTLVAMKRVNKEIFDEVILAKRILREIKLLAHFHDDNIVGLKNLLTPPDEDFEFCYIVMDIMETDLKQVLRSGQKLTDAHIRFFVYQALRALRVIHAAGVIHRDITPANILVNTNCDLKICDFGLAKEEAEGTEEMTDYVTMRWYRAPELVMEHRSYSPQIDIWGVGCILGELLGSRPLFQGKDRVNQLDKIIDVIGTPEEDDIMSIGSPAAQKYLKKKGRRDRVVFDQKYPSASPESLDLLEKLLVFHPEKRISVADAMRHPYLQELHDEDDEKLEVPSFVFDEHKHRSIHDVKRAILDETNSFHKRNPKTAPKARTAATVHAEDSDGRTGQNLIHQREDEDESGKFEEDE